MSINNKVSVSPLFIDKLVFLLNPEGNRDEFERNALEVLNNRDKDKIFGNPYIKGNRYKHNFEVVFGADTIILIQIYPLQDNNSMIRIELNPQKMGFDGLQILKDILVKLFGPAMEAELRKATISMMDVTVDLTGCHINDLLAHREKSKKSCLFWGDHGEVETIYIGTPKSPRQVKIYNKRAEVLQKSKVDIGVETTRVECSLMLGKRSAQNLLTLENPFSDLHICSVDDSVLDDCSDMTRLFLDSCRYRGWTAALARVKDPKRRENLRNRLSARYKANWWNADTVWSGFASAISKLGLFPVVTLERIAVGKDHDIDEDDE